MPMQRGSRRPATGGRGSPRRPVRSASRSRALFVVALAIFGISVAALTAVVVTGTFSKSPDPAATVTPVVSPTSAPPTALPPSPTPLPPTVVPTPTLPPSTYAELPVACDDLMVPLDKQHVLARDCVPRDMVQLPAAISVGAQNLTATTIAALQELFTAAAKDGFPTFKVNSSYRSYDVQAATYNGYVSSLGQAQADRTSARPGHSEHQLGTTADVCARGLCLENFTGSPEAAWIFENSWKYGFIVSYPDGKEPITGYAYEPWHIRYLGKEIAKQAHESGLTLHEFLLRR